MRTDKTQGLAMEVSAAPAHRAKLRALGAQGRRDA
jgi:hypothetical protein